MDSPNPYAPPGAEVQDIYDPTVTLELADRGTRLGAALLDGIIMGVMVYGPFLIAFIIAAGMGSSDGPNTGVLVGGVILACIGFVIWCWLTIRDVARNGQTIAKKMLGIRVVRSDGTPATLGRIFWLRNVVNGLISIVPLYGIVDVLFIFADERQCLHDKLADTIVVKAQGAQAPAMTGEVLDTVVATETPEGIVLELRPAGLSARFYAFLLDLTLRGVALNFMAIPLGLMGGMGLGILLIVAFLIEWLYPVAMDLA